MAARSSIWPLRAAVVVPIRGPQGLQLVLDVLTQLDALTLEHNAAIPRLYSSGVRYSRESRMMGDLLEVAAVDPRTGTVEERFNHLTRVLELGAGDCDDLACWRAAELQVRDGINARAVPLEQPGGGYHVVVRYPNGRAEDPSARLGMLTPEGSRR